MNLFVKLSRWLGITPRPSIRVPVKQFETEIQVNGQLPKITLIARGEAVRLDDQPGS